MPRAHATQASAEDFVRLWQSSPSAEHVATSLGLETETVIQRASRFRRRGVPLKKMPRGGAAAVGRLDVGALVRVAGEGGER